MVEDRWVESRATVCVGDEGCEDSSLEVAHPPAPLADFAVSEPAASQRSTLGVDIVEGLVRNDPHLEHWPGGNTTDHGESGFDVTFRVDKPCFYRVDVVAPFEGGYNRTDVNTAGLVLVGPAWRRCFAGASTGCTGPSDAPVGHLSAGAEYRLHSVGGTRTHDDTLFGRIDFALILMPVPEPGATLAGGAAVAAVAAIRRRAGSA